MSLFNVRLTAVAATRTSDYTVVFIGTADGHLKKVVVESASSATEYADIVIDNGSPINSDMHFDNDRMHVYVMSKRHVSKVKVHDCSIYKTCGECLGAKDPYCGWCSLENKCSLRSNCQDDQNDPLYWVSYKMGKCTTITSVIPNQLQRTTARTVSFGNNPSHLVVSEMISLGKLKIWNTFFEFQLELIIDHLPQLKENLVCAFTTAEKTLFTEATKKRNGVNCTTPRTDMLPQIEPGERKYSAFNISKRFYLV